MKFLDKLRVILNNQNPKNLLLHLLLFPKRRFKRIIDLRHIREGRSLEERFTIIYERNAWGSSESVSGSGSSLHMTQNLRDLLPVLIEKFRIKSIFDAPCGDFNWMKLVNLQDISYIGGDIVQPLILDLQTKFGNDKREFRHFDITKQVFPKVDLVLVRDCLFHLSYDDIVLCLENFLDSESSLLLTTSYVSARGFRNCDIQSSDFRYMNLFEFPFNFKNDYLFEILEPSEGTLPGRGLFLWNNAQVQQAYKMFKQNLREL